MRNSLVSIGLGFGLGLGLIASGGVTSAQVIGNVSGNCTTTGSPGNWTIMCGDLNPGPGTTLIAPPTRDTSTAAGESGIAIESPPSPAPAPAPAPVTEPAPETLADTSTTATGTQANRA